MGRPVISEKFELNHDEEHREENSPIIHNSERIIFLAGDLTEESIAGATASLFSMVNKNRNKPIKIIISSQGGDIYEAVGFYDAIKFVQSLGCPVQTIGIGKIMSAGVLLLACGDKGRRLIGKNTCVMYHHSYSDGVIDGSIFDLETELNEHKRLEKNFNQLLSENSNMSIEEIEEMLKDKQDVYMTAEYAIKLGIADHILGS